MTGFSSFDEPIDALVVGANGGLGRAFVEALVRDELVRSVNAWSRGEVAFRHDKLSSGVIDIDDESQVASSASAIGRLSLVIVATGILHNHDGMFPEKSWKDIDPGQLAESFRINAILPALVAKHTLPCLPRRGKAAFCVLSARVGSISDNRLGGWYSYRAGKAALNQIVRCLSIELSRKRPDSVCIGLHPGTVDTGLSEPFHKSLRPASRLFSPDESVLHLLQVVDTATPELSGSLLAWDGSVIPP